MGAQPGQRLYAGKTAEESALYDFEQAQRKQAQAAAQQNLLNEARNWGQTATASHQARADSMAAQAAQMQEAAKESQAALSQRVAADRAVADQFKAVQMDMGDTTANRLGPRPQAAPQGRAPQAPPKMSRQQFQQLQQRNPQAAQQYQQQVQNFQRASAPRPQGPQRPQGGGGPDFGAMATGLGMNLGGKALESFGVPSGITKGLTGFLGKLF
jgi:hypothetical protein